MTFKDEVEVRQRRPVRKERLDSFGAEDNDESG